MTASIEFFPVGDGDMTLVRLASGKTILIDINIRQKADQEEEGTYPDVATMLKERLDRHEDKYLFVDVFMLSHPDQDHCAGLEKHFHLGNPSDWEEPDEDEPEKIIIREMWSSPLTFRRTDDIEGELTPNAQAWRDEAKRRVKLHKDADAAAGEDGNLIKVLGEDVHHTKTDGIEDIIVKVGESINEICGYPDPSFSALLLSPQLVSEEEAEELPGKNNSSIVMQFSLAAEEGDDQHFDARFLTGGDAEVDIWKRIWGRNHETPENLAYDILQTPHHCSLGALSYDFYNDHEDTEGRGEECEIDDDAYSALSQAEDKAFIVASCDEPEEKSGKGLARKKYSALSDEKNGTFLCTMVDSPDKPLKIAITKDGVTKSGKKAPPQDVPPKPYKGKTEKSYA